MNIYTTFMSTNYKPKDYYKKNVQNILNQSFDNSTTVLEKEDSDCVEQENSFGSLEFHPIEARITSIIDPRTGDRVADDFKQLLFKDLDYSPQLGTRFRIGDNIWITYSTDTIKVFTKSIYIRRCNNVLGMQDKYGNIHYEPCYVDYKATKTSLTESYQMSVPYTKQVIMCQFNEWTRKIGLNDRFVLSGNVYKVSDRPRFSNVTTYMDLPNMLKLHVDYDGDNEYDRIDLRIADYKIPNYAITTLGERKGLIDSTQKVEYVVTLDGKPVSEEVEWCTQDETIAYIDDNEYIHYVGIGETTITCKMKNNEIFRTDIDVQVYAELQQTKEVVVEPSIDCILIGQTQTFEAFEFINGEKLDTNFTFEINGSNKRSYKISTDNNKFTITTIYSDDKPLEVKCIAEDGIFYNKIIELGGVF